MNLDEARGADDAPFTDDEIRILAQVSEMPQWPTIRSVLLRYIDRSTETIQDFKADLNHIREAQGRCALARQFLDLLEQDAPRLYEQRHKKDAEHDAPE
jgi:hypothetical protein